MKFQGAKMADVWAMFYVGVVSMQFHPRNEVPVNYDELAKIADAMLERYIERVPEEKLLCRG